MKSLRRILSILLVIALSFSYANGVTQAARKVKAPKLSVTKKKNLKVGKTLMLTIKKNGVKKIVSTTWKTNKKKLVALKAKKKTSVRVYAKKTGSVKVTATVKYQLKNSKKILKKKLVCNIKTVKRNGNQGIVTPDPNITPTPTVTPKATIHVDITPTPTVPPYDSTICRMDIWQDDSSGKTGGKEPYFPLLAARVMTRGIIESGTHLNYEPCEFGGRGNSTWYYSFNWANPYQSKKLAYKLEFNNKVNMLDIPGEKSKKWVLLAMRFDKTLIKSALMFDLASELSFQFTPRYRFVRLYVNNSYKGLYMVTDQIETGGSRVDIKTEDTETDTQPGFLLEWDFKALTADEEEDPDYPGTYLPAKEGEDYFLIDGINGSEKVPFVYKGPKPKDLNKVPNDAARQYIQNYMRTASATMKNCADNDEYLNYIDVTTFYDYFIAAEFAKNVDAASHSSIFLTKPKDGKLQMGPIWDYDLTFGYTEGFTSPEGWHVKNSNGWYRTLIRDNKTFRLGLKDRWNEVKPIIEETFINGIDTTKNYIYDEAVENHQYWGELGTRIWPSTGGVPSQEETCFNTYDEYISHLKTWSQARLNWMDTMINAWSETVSD